jgi:hypothetical protein
VNEVAERKVDFDLDLGAVSSDAWKNEGANDSEKTISIPVHVMNVQYPDYKQVILDYLNAILGDKDSVVVNMQELKRTTGMNSKTLQKHVNRIRGKEFNLTSVGYGTLVERIAKSENAES